jgi:glycosyltransferase involved in cell wall biosynthesis
MKVLMFGWEFPPHISGGLGTACAGLTRALENENIEVLFVVPKLHGGEQAKRTRFINASAVPITYRETNKAKQHQTCPSPPSVQVHAGTISKAPSAETKTTRTTIEVPSYLDPYTLTTGSAERFEIQSWNYTIKGAVWPQHNNSERSQAEKAEPGVTSRKKPHAFSGTYGVNLIEEVAHYTEVGAEIGRANQFDVIHAHDWMTYRAGIAASKVSGKPLVVHVHATEIDRSGASVNTLVFEIEKEGMMKADKVVAVSQWTKKIAVEHYGIDERKIEVVHNGISPKQYSTAPNMAPPIGSRIVTFLGRITHQKGPMYFVEAAKKVHDSFPDAHFVVAGSGDLLPKMIERIAQLKLSHKFHFTGFLKGEDIDRVWSMSTVYVMPSVSEPFGIAPLEAIQAGVPVILSKQAGVGEVMSHAIKVDFWDTDALAEAMCSVLRFKSLADTLKENGAEEVKMITWDKAARKLISLYHKLTSKHEKPENDHPVLSGSSTTQTSNTSVLRHRSKSQLL